MPRVKSMSITDMPNGDFAAVMWMQNFATQLAADREALGVPPETCEEITALVNDFDEKFHIAKSPSSNTKPNVEAKTLARNAAVLAIRPLVKQLKDNPALSAAQLLTLGIEPHEYAARRRKRKAARQRRVVIS